MDGGRGDHGGVDAERVVRGDPGDPGAVLLALRPVVTRGLPAVVTALPGLVLLISLVHIHWIDDMIGIGHLAQPLN